MPKRIDLKDQRFEMLYVVSLSDRRDERNVQLWECRCDCEKTVYLSGSSLRAGHYKSCGCVHDSKRDAGVKKHIAADRTGGTRKTALKAKLHKGNKSGHKGVKWLENRGKWLAYIGYRGKSINLGYYQNKDDAIAARRMAEEKYHAPHLNEEPRQP
ncbi:MAG: HNH endonuclease [Cohnella sp.]|nr:HNH endonuclease [Cohnella sp.]